MFQTGPKYNLVPFISDSSSLSRRYPAMDTL